MQTMFDSTEALIPLPVLLDYLDHSQNLLGVQLHHVTLKNNPIAHGVFAPLSKQLVLNFLVLTGKDKEPTMMSCEALHDYFMSLSDTSVFSY